MNNTSVSPLDFVLVSGICSEPVVCVVSTNGKEIIISTKTPLSNAMVDNRIIHSNLGSLIDLVGIDTSIYSEITQVVSENENIGNNHITKDALLLVRAFYYLKSNYNLKTLTDEPTYKVAIDEAILHAEQIQLNVEKCHFSIAKLTMGNLKMDLPVCENNSNITNTSHLS